MMKHKSLLLLLLAMLTSTTLQAYDAEIDGINYNFISNNEAEVTAREEGQEPYTGSIVIPESVTWDNKTYSVTRISDGAFRDCHELTSVNMPNGLTSIGGGAFYCCSGLTSTNIPNGMTSIGESAFLDTRLTSVTIPSSVTNIGGAAFCNNPELAFISVDEDNPIYDSREDCNAIIETATNTLISGCNNTIIPNSVTSIPDNAFIGSGITSIVIPGSVTSIGINAFGYCENLTSITLSEGLTSIASNAFMKCVSLESICIPESVTSIGGGILGPHPSLTSISVKEGNWFYDSRDDCNAIIETATNTIMLGCQNTIIPDDVECIGDGAFEGCSSLTSITIPDNVTSIGAAFTGCSNLSSITIGSGVTEIGHFAFDGCSSLTSITIPDNVTEIDACAFSGCSSLNIVAIGSGITDIHEAIFNDCNRLRNIYCYAEQVPNTVDNSFQGVNMRVAKLHVPPTSVEAYKTTEPWSGFKNIVGIESYALTYMVDGEEYKSYQIMEGKPIVPEEEPTKEGFTFSDWSEIPETMPAQDVTVTGTFTINSYTLTYIVDGEEYKTDTLEYNAAITPEDIPVKEGCTFSGWSEIPETMPAHDVIITGTFAVNPCTIVFNTNGGSPIEFISGEAGSEITPPADPTREGYTFLGWEPAIPETMPEEGLIVVAQWQINSYTLLYMVGDEEYSRREVEYGTEITPIEEPTKEGYTFSGWSEIPETMPAKDVTVTGSFTINQYLLTYLVDGEEYKSYEVDYNTPLTPEAEPTRKGMTFSGWDEMPETMPTNDLTITGSFSWSKETLGGIVYEVADTLSNYASVIGYEGESEEAELLSEVEIGGDVYTVYSIAEEALPHTITINVAVGRLLLCLWSNGYEYIRETESGRDLPAPEVSVASTASSLTLSFVNDYPEFSEMVEFSGNPIEKGENGYSMKLTGLEPDYELLVSAKTL